MQKIDSIDEPLSVIRSMISPESLKIATQKFYPSLGNCDISPLSFGDNDHYLVQTLSDKYVLRLYRHNKHWLLKDSNYLFEIDLLNFLKNSAVNVAYPLQRCDDHYLGKISTPEGIRYWAMFTYAAGSKMKFDENGGYSYGQYIAKFHLETNNFKSKYTKDYIDLKFLVDLPMERLKPIFENKTKDEMNLLMSIAKELRKKVNDYVSQISRDEWGVIGGDFHGHNHFCLPGGDIISFDYDLCGYGWRIYDLAIFRWSLFGMNHDNPKTENLELIWQSFLKGYQTYRPLTKKDLSTIQAFAAVRQIWMMGSKPTYKDYILDSAYWNNMLLKLRSLFDTNLIEEI